MFSVAQREALQATVQRWFARYGRIFPWRSTENTFHILLAEVLLRRTQAERVVEPYLDLVGRYPDVWCMAKADVSCLREWFRPLGLISRADQLVHLANAIVTEHAGEVPRDLGHLMRLPGLGRYSARAVACLAYGDAVPMVDESSGRILRRLTALSETRPAYSDRGLLSDATSLLPHSGSRAFNLGLLDIAARYCHVGSPSCGRCPLRRFCAYGTASHRKLAEMAIRESR